MNVLVDDTLTTIDKVYNDTYNNKAYDNTGGSEHVLIELMIEIVTLRYFISMS